MASLQKNESWNNKISSAVSAGVGLINPGELYYACSTDGVSLNNNDKCCKDLIPEHIISVPKIEPIEIEVNIEEVMNWIKIKKVIYNPPATIVFWDDNTKTVAKCNDSDCYSPEAGFAICVAKKYRKNYYKDLNNSIVITQEQWDEYYESYKSLIGDKRINLSRVNHLDIDDKFAISRLLPIKDMDKLKKVKKNTTEKDEN